MTSHEGRVAVVTGAAQGLGRAIAERLSSDGFAVAAIDIASGEFVADVSDADEVRRAVGAVLQKLGRVDVLVNNAGIFPWRDWLEITPEEWDRVLAVNLKGAFLMSQACVPDMTSRSWGRVISISSATALTGAPTLMHYAASKAGLLGFTRSLAAAVGDSGVTVNAVTTGKTLTEGFRQWFDDGTLDEEETQRSRASQPIKRLATPEDIVGTISFLASDDAAYMTGQLLNVDGGRNNL